VTPEPKQAHRLLHGRFLALFSESKTEKKQRHAGQND